MSPESAQRGVGPTSPTASFEHTFIKHLLCARTRQGAIVSAVNQRDEALPLGGAAILENRSKTIGPLSK